MADYCADLPEDDINDNICSCDEAPPEDEVLVPWFRTDFFGGRQKEHMSLPNPLTYSGCFLGCPHVTGRHMKRDNGNQQYASQDE